ncbi:DUF1700 domain-containing protein [Clostridium sp. BL-8]|uniref:DUF1700 domain-containing protein n=1 Tax=Clostridium sp. BL-8 TaxID=349938 RepID=UPI00098C547E|nr:DUF1700 domain-containing protein [Clostridium sp. BL-8]OOM76163.1 hypothetical protein CLOBL_37120 [Clostridium sp. BL-8]
MTQNEFFNILMDGLKDIPEKNLQDIISFYDNIFTLGLAAGKTENEIINELGDPNLIIHKYRNEDLTLTTPNYTTDNINIKDSNVDDPTFAKNKNMDAHNKSNDFKTTNLFTTDYTEDRTENNSKSNDYNSNFNYNKNSGTFANNFSNKNYGTKKLRFNVNTILKLCIAILSLIILFPVITGVIGCIIGLFGAAIGIFAASIGVLIGGTFTSIVGLPNLPAFITDFPYPVVVLFSLGSISLSILFILLFYYLCKFFVKILIKIYHSLKSKGDAL